MSKNYVLDSSVYVKLLIPEKDSKIIEKFFAEILSQGDYILVPSIFLYEIISVLKKHRCDKKTIEDFIMQYYTNQLYIKVFDLEAKIISQALEISSKKTKQTGYFSFYDASYHALAILNKCDFITADKKYYEKSKELGYINLLANIK